MRSKSVYSNSHLSLPVTICGAKVWSALIISLLLTACGGGISGTGDGGIIQPTNSQSTDSESSGSMDNIGNTADIDSGSDSGPDSDTDAGIADGADPTPQSPTTDSTCLLYTSPSPRDRG